MADCSSVDEAINASRLGADIVASTLSGYTTKKTPKNPDFRMISNFKNFNLQTPIIAEGRIYSPNQAQKSIKLGAHSVVVGTAINRVEIITSWFSNGIHNVK